MEKITSPLYMAPSTFSSSSSSSKSLHLSRSPARGRRGGTKVVQEAKHEPMAIVGQLVRNIFNSDLREKALLELSKVIHVCSHFSD